MDSTRFLLLSHCLALVAGLAEAGRPAIDEARWQITRLGGCVTSVLDARGERGTKITLARTLVKDEDLRLLAAFPDIQELDLDSTAISDDGLAHLKDIRCLQVLDIGFTKINGSGYGHLEKHVFPSLRSLNIGGTKFAAHSTEKLAACKQLEELTCNESTLSDADLRYVSSLINLRYLKSDGAENITGVGLIHLKDLPYLTTLVLTGSEGTDETLGSIAKLRHIRHLSLASNKIDIIRNSNSVSF